MTSATTLATADFATKLNGVAFLPSAPGRTADGTTWSGCVHPTR